MMKTQVCTLVLLSLWSITRITADSHDTLRHSHPYYVQTFPIHSAPQLNHAAWSGVRTPGSADSSGRLQSFGVVQQTANIQYNGQFLKPPAPIGYQTITITDYTRNGTRENRLTSRLSNPVDIAKLFQSFEKASQNQSPWTNTFSKVPDTYSYNLVGNGQPSYDTLYALGGVQFQPEVKYGSNPSGFGGYSTVRPLFHVFPTKSPQYGGISTVVPPFGGFSTQNPAQFNPGYHKLFKPYNAPSQNQFSFEFPSSDELNNVWGNKVDQDTEEKVEDRRSTTLRQTKKFVQAALDAHNGYRKKHKAAALSYNQQVAKVAQAWANKLIGSIARGGHLQHRPNNKYGENLWMGSGYKFTDEEAVKFAVKSWYDEISIYKPFLGREPNMANFMKWGHFTQVVWKSSARLGMGIARKNGYIVVVANYDPPGNFKGVFGSNVKKP